MKLINAELQAKELKLKQLSQELQDEIAQHKEMIVKYNMACDEYDNDEEEDVETEKKLDEQEDFLARNESDIAKRIREIPAPKKEPAPSEPTSEPAPAPTPAATTPKKSENSAGWLIFGGAVLLVTLGAVNVFKKK
jgi:septum formation inhibitor MinC